MKNANTRLLLKKKKNYRCDVLLTVIRIIPQKCTEVNLNNLILTHTKFLKLFNLK